MIDISLASDAQSVEPVRDKEDGRLEVSNPVAGKLGEADLDGSAMLN